ncbi:MAG: hypothetical protein OK438_01380 [Thaumarchaeota archaeon]|nr:hypothetical protein [Nitrososphaerota archaeon]
MTIVPLAKFGGMPGIGTIMLNSAGEFRDKEGLGVPGYIAEEAGNLLSKLASPGPLSRPLVVTGKSGIVHTFAFGFGDLGKPTVACDIVVGSNPVDETKVLSLFIKVYDVGAKNAILCVIPSLMPQAKKLAGLYKIIVVEALDKNQAASRLAEVLEKISTPR